MLEWTDDLELFILKGYGSSLNYRMGVPLLHDVIQSMDQAIEAKEGEERCFIFLPTIIHELFMHDRFVTTDS